ncbi:peptidyl-prolyl cis-trans isomerase [bacterium]|nr:peptidyl-prolyl cis-trans isomerase [bacterium]
MLRKTALLVAVALLGLGLLAAGCGEGGGGRVVARVGSKDITEMELRAKLAELPPFTQQQFAGPEGMTEFLDRVIEEEVLYQAAERAGYENAREVQEMLAAVKRRTMIQAYYRSEIEEKATVPEDDIIAYYDEHPEQFHQRAEIKFRHIMRGARAEAIAARDRILAGEDFASVAREASEDEATRQAGGLVRTLKKGDGLMTSGMSALFIESLFDGNVGEVSQPVRSDRGWHIVRIEELRPEGTKPLEQVRDTIEQSLKPRITREYYAEQLEVLKDQLNATVNEAALRPQARSEEELFTLAQDTEDPLARMSYYTELVFSFPDGAHADEAQFMIGFIQAEELKNYDAARNALRRMLERYPDSELTESAQWMLENMGSEAPPFDESDGLTGE